MAYGQINADQISTSVANSSLGAGNATLMKNKIINGACVIDQRNAGASVSVGTATGTYTLDRWRVYHDTAITSNITAQQSSTAPTGFVNSIVLTNGTGATPAAGDFNVFQQRIEGYNTSDLGFGTASAKTVTLSFQVYSSLTGTFAVGLSNSAQDRSYVANYTISSASTWTTVSVTIVGDTSGTWLTTNGIGLIVNWDLGSGSSHSQTANTWASGQNSTTSGATKFISTTGATFYITGVQLEVGSSATGFEYRQYGQELALCQRYYQKTTANWNVNTASTYVTSWHQVTMRTTPTPSGGGSGYTYVGDGNIILEYQSTRASQPMTYSAEL